MLARINVVLLVLLTIGLGVTAWQSWQSQNRTADAVEKLGVKIESMNAQQSAAPGTVTINGDVPRGGVYGVPAEGMTVRRLLAAAGWDGKTEVDVNIDRWSIESAKVETTTIAWATIVDPRGDDEALRIGDLLVVRQIGKAAGVVADKASQIRRSFAIEATQKARRFLNSSSGFLLPVSGMTLKRALIVAYWNGIEPLHVTIQRLGVNGTNTTIEVPWSVINDPDQPVAIMDNDIVRVRLVSEDVADGVVR